MKKMMENQCSFSKVLPSCGNLCGNAALVMLKDCRDEISGHLQSVHFGNIEAFRKRTHPCESGNVWDLGRKTVKNGYMFKSSALPW